eukprot:4397308-Ditylum_brightwellii.AAC.1
MCQVKVGNLLEKGYIIPLVISEEYELHKTKDVFLKNHLLTATMGSNASLFINIKTMNSLQMYNKLLGVFQGLEHDADTVSNATFIWERLKFNKNMRYSAEVFLAKINECLKKMGVDDGAGGAIKPFNDAIIPSLLRAKVEHSAFDT